MFNTTIFDGQDGDFLNSQPIDITYQRQPSIFNNLRFRRELIAHSQGMGGVLWGSVTIGLWLKDEVMMLQNPVPTMINPRRGLVRFHAPVPPMSPPNTTSYLPTLEADYCKDYLCCGQLLPTLHDLLRHYEEAHISLSPPHEPNPLLNTHRARPNIHNGMETVSTNDVFLNNQTQMHLLPHFSLQQQALNPGAMNTTILPSLALNQPEQAPLPPAPGVSPLAASQPPAHRALLQPLDPEDSMYIDDPARHLYVMENEEYKPFKCPVIGCEKTYKNQNGLKYHRLHGHQNQTLKENDDGTFSIIDPESNTPYVDGAGMEKDKPYRCEVCGKRYKNLNGLKYHRGHTTH